MPRRSFRYSRGNPRVQSDTAQAFAVEAPSPKRVSQSVRRLAGPEATYVLGALEHASQFSLSWSVVGSSELFVTYYLDNKNDKEHIAQQRVTFSLRAHASKIAYQLVAIGEAFQLPVDESDKRGAFDISVGDTFGEATPVSYSWFRPLHNSRARISCSAGCGFPMEHPRGLVVAHLQP